MKRILASVALAASMAAVNQPQPVESVVGVPTVADFSPGDKCCGDVCKCCDNCDCEGCEQPAKVQDSKPAKVARKVRDFGHVEIINGLAHRMVARWQEGDVWKYRYQPINQPAQTLSNVASGGGGVRWTYPGTINNHLSSTHGLSQSQLFNKSQAEMESIHNSLHNSTRYAPAQPVYRRPAVSQSNCPGGVCPQPQRRGWIR